jgi:phage I-like protein
MTKPFGYLIDLSEVKLSESGTPTSWIHAMSIGTYKHALYGEIKFDETRVKRFADSVINKTRGVEPDIDYDHKRRRDDAAGWVKNANTREDGLWLFVEWTKEAAQKIRDKQYRYFSPEFLDEWQDAQGNTHTDVLSGGALTNRPFLKNLVPVNLSEYETQFDDQLPGAKEEEDEGKDAVKLSDIAKLVGLSEDATEEQVTTKIKALSERPEPKNEPGIPSDLKALAETNPAIKVLMEQVRETNDKLRLAEVTGQVRALHEHARSKGYALPASIDEDLTKALHEAGPTVGGKFVEVLKALSEKGLVKLGETGHAGQNSGEGADPKEAFTAKVKKFQEDNKDTPYVDAVMAVAMSDPEGYRAYAHGSYSEIK